MNILLAVDGSPYTKKMLAYLAAHDEMLGTSHSYTAITVQPQLPPRARATLGQEELDKYYAEESEKVLAPVVKFLGRQGVQLKTISKVGPAGETIAKTAESGKFDLVVMGTHGHGSLGKLVMGSVSTQVLANCTVPVLLVR
jgi:nucleotide-binding universal stress UspA family protein